MPRPAVGTKEVGRREKTTPKPSGVEHEPPILPTTERQSERIADALSANLERMRVPFRSRTAPSIEFCYSSYGGEDGRVGRGRHQRSLTRSRGLKRARIMARKYGATAFLPIPLRVCSTKINLFKRINAKSSTLRDNANEFTICSR